MYPFFFIFRSSCHNIPMSLHSIISFRVGSRSKSYNILYCSTMVDRTVTHIIYILFVAFWAHSAATKHTSCFKMILVRFRKVLFIVKFEIIRLVFRFLDQMLMLIMFSMTPSTRTTRAHRRYSNPSKTRHELLRNAR